MRTYSSINSVNENNDIGVYLTSYSSTVPISPYRQSTVAIKGRLLAMGRFRGKKPRGKMEIWRGRVGFRHEFFLFFLEQ